MSPRTTSVSMRPRIAFVSTTAESQGIRLRAPPQSTVDAAPATARSAVSSARKGSKKTRTGCITCKIRRIKCDESKPACLRCQKTGRQCDGYRPSPGSRATSSQLLPDVRGRPDAQGPSATPPPRYTISAKTEWSPSEKRAFHFYQQFTAKDIFSSISADFWTKVIPVLCFHEPAIRHAVFAIGNLQETRYLRQCPSKGPALSNPFAAVQYGKALRCLQTWKFPAHDVLAGTVATVLPLLSCALFICIEFMLSDASAAHVHIGQGRRLLAHFEAGSGRSPAAELVRRELVPIFTRLSLASFLLGSVPDPIPSELRWTATPFLESDAHVYAFDTLIEAAQTMYEIMDDACEFGRETRLWAFSAEAQKGGSPEQRAWYEERQQTFLSRLGSWHGAFKSLEKRGSNNDYTGLVAMMYFHMVKVFVGVSLEPQGHREPAYDNHIADFANIVLLAGRLNILEASEAEPGTRFSFEPGFIPPLNLATAKCRHPHIRRAALALLTRRATLQQTENMWDSNQVQRVAERVMLLEESGGWDFVDLDDSAGGVYQQDALSFFEGGPGHEGRDLSSVSGDSAANDSFRHISTASQRWTTADPPAWPCVPANRPLAWHTTPYDALTEMTTWKQPTDSSLDPGAAWVDAHPLAAEHVIPREHRIHSVIVKPQGRGRSLLKLFVLPDADDPSRWGFFQEQMAVEGAVSCT